MVAKKTARPKTFTRKKPTTSPAKQIKKQLVKQEEMLEEIKTLIEHEPRPVETVERTSISTTKETKPMSEELQVEKVVKVEKVDSAKQNAEVGEGEKVDEVVAVDSSEKNIEKEKGEPKEEDSAEQNANGEKTEDIKDNEGSGTSKKRFWINLVIIFVGTVIIVTFFLFLRQQKIDEMNKQEQANTPKPTKAVKTTPTPEEVDLAAYSIDVQNGSGIAGAAAKAKTLLVGKDFNVASTGNADSSDYAKTIIKAKDAVPSAYIDALKEALSPSYDLDTVETLADSENSDVVIIIGSQTPQ